MELGSLPSIQGTRKSQMGGRVPLPWNEITLQTRIWALWTMNCQASLLENNPHHPIRSPHFKSDSNTASPVLGHLPEGREGTAQAQEKRKQWVLPGGGHNSTDLQPEGSHQVGSPSSTCLKDQSSPHPGTGSGRTYGTAHGN